MLNTSNDFAARAVMAREPILSDDVFSKPAQDMIRIAAFAGFDTKDLMVRCFKSSTSSKINVATVERIMGEMSNEPVGQEA